MKSKIIEIANEMHLPLLEKDKQEFATRIDSLCSGGVSEGELINLIADLREVFPFPSDRDYDNGYDIEKKDGWCVSNIVASPKICLEMMIAVSDTLQSHPTPEINDIDIVESMEELEEKAAIWSKGSKTAQSAHEISEGENNHKMVDFVDSLAPISEYVDGDKIAHRFYGLTIPVIEFNEMRDKAKKWKSKGAKPEVAHCTQCGYHYDSLLKECPTCKGAKPMSEESIEEILTVYENLKANEGGSDSIEYNKSNKAYLQLKASQVKAALEEFNNE